MNNNFNEDFSFYQQILLYYQTNRGKIRSRYNSLTKKFLAYNDANENPDAFLRRPQFEALEIYVFIKEFMGNAQVYEMFDDWRNRRDKFSDASYYSINARSSVPGQIRIGDALTEKQTDTLFKQMKIFSESYSNYIFALTMGLGKTILMATCIFYEFLLANKYPKDKKFCHNALIFAPDKTVLQSLREIITFDKSKVVPPEYINVLNQNIKFHFLDDNNTTLQTLDDSQFNIIISNTQKIIVKQKRKDDKPAEVLFSGDSLLSTVYGDEDSGLREGDLIENQRFKKLCRLKQLGVYVDEAHHLFGSELEKALRSKNSTSLRTTINKLDKNTSLVACYNYTGTPYVKQQILPEVVYAYGLKESIQSKYLKDVDLYALENVKSQGFLRYAVNTFWNKYSDNKYEGLHPKLAIFASTIDEAVNEVQPTLEKILSELNIPIDKILVNVGDSTITKSEDIRNFNNLDIEGSAGNKKQFIILVGKGREGWNCRSLFGVAMYRSPKSKIFVLQATMRCLREITEEQQTASVFLSKDNYDILEAELNKNFNMDIKDLKNKNSKPKSTYKVRVLPPPRKFKLKRTWREYTFEKGEYEESINFSLDSIDTKKYEATLYEKDGLTSRLTVKATNIDELKENEKYSSFTLAAEISRYLNTSPILMERILKESIDGVNKIIDYVNKYNEIIYDIIVPRISEVLYIVKSEIKSEDKEYVLLREPQNSAYYEFTSQDDLVVKETSNEFSEKEVEKSFHADTYCFDSKPELECFLQYIKSDKVNEVYFTGMFTSNQGDLSIQYYDPESQRIRNYYPDFFAKMSDGSYRLIEVKGDNKIDDTVVKAKAEAAEEMSSESGIEYIMYPGSKIMNTRII